MSGNEKSPRDFFPNEDVQVKINGQWVAGKVIEPVPAKRERLGTNLRVEVPTPKGIHTTDVKPRNVRSLTQEDY